MWVMSFSTNNEAVFVHYRSWTWPDKVPVIFYLAFPWNWHRERMYLGASRCLAFRQRSMHHEMTMINDYLYTRLSTFEALAVPLYHDA